jgi:hypothetical protein
MPTSVYEFTLCEPKKSRKEKEKKEEKISLTRGFKLVLALGQTRSDLFWS